MVEFKCPHCGSIDIGDSDCSDIEVTFDYKRKNDVVLRKINGYCENCGATDLTWTEVYELVGCKDLKVSN